MIRDAISAAVETLKQIGQIPDHIWHLSLVALGVILSLAHQKELGATLVTAGLAMFRGQQQ